MSTSPQDIGMGGISSSQPSWSVGNTLGATNAALGAYRGAQSGTPQGYATSAIDTGKLAGMTGALGARTSTANQGIGDAANALGIYQGIKQGGVSGYGSAAINAGQLGVNGAVQSGMVSAADAAPWMQGLGYAAIPLDIYNEVNSWKSGATGADALAGAETGAAIGSVVPVIGTVIGGLVGGAAGAISSAFGPGARDPETTDYGNLADYYNKAGTQGGRTAQQDVASQVQDPYEALAGMFALHNGQVDPGDTLYNQYGRNGEQKFTTDLTNQLQSAKASGAINPNMDASQIYSSVVQPWEDSWGKGQNTDPNAQFQQDLVTQMISQYEGGQANQNWRAVGGDNPFANIYAHAPNPSGASATTQAAPMAKPPTLDRLGVPMKGYKDGGRAKRKSVLDSIRPSFADAPKTNFDDGGYVSYFTPDTPYSLMDAGNYSEPTMQDPGLNLDQGNESSIVNSANDPAGYGYNTSQGGGGIGGLLKGAAPYAAALPLLSALGSKLSGSGSSPSTALPSGQSTTTGPFQAQASPRTANKIDPNTDWYTYGQHPETQFFSNNSIGPLMGKFAAQPGAAPAPQTSVVQPGGPGTMNAQPVIGPRPIMRAHGGALDMAGEGPQGDEGSRYVRGPGDGQSDDIDAKLSNGEYVMDAHTVSLLGNGSNESGAQRLDQLRENLRKSAAKPMAKGKQFMHAKPPEAYMKMAKGGHVKGRGKPVVFDLPEAGTIRLFKE